MSLIVGIKFEIATAIRIRTLVSETAITSYANPGRQMHRTQKDVISYKHSAPNKYLRSETITCVSASSFFARQTAVTSSVSLVATADHESRQKAP